MNIRINPFKPNYPVSPGMFVGRIDEIERLEAHILQTRSGQPTNFMITGERGIGKSSLLNYIKWVAEGHIPIKGTKVNFLVIDTDIDQKTTQMGLIRKIELGLRRKLAESETARKFFAEAWGFIQRVEASGFKLSAKGAEENEETLFDEFSYSLGDTCSRICDNGIDRKIFSSNYEGVLIVIDEADNASPSLRLGSFFKLLLERLNRRGCSNICIGIAGLPDLKRVLTESHESSLRLFEDITLGTLEGREVFQVVDMCMKKANDENQLKTDIDDDAKNLLSTFSDGYPHFIQQAGYCSFAVDEDYKIDRSDVAKGIFGSGGALQLIGDRYYRDNFYNKIQKESYRQVLRIMAERLNEWVSKKEIRDKFKGTESVLANALKALRDRHIIISREGEKGIYRLQHKGFALWIKYYTIDPEEQQKKLLQTSLTIHNELQESKV